MSDTSDLEADIFDRWQTARRDGIRFSAAALDQLLSPLTEDRQKAMRGLFSMIEGMSHATKVQGPHTNDIDAIRQRWLLVKLKLEAAWDHALTRWYGKLAVTLLCTPFVGAFWGVLAAYWFVSEVWRWKGK